MLWVLALVPTVAVLPFRDLSGGRGQVGEAIRETVTVDLKDVPGLKVIERSAIDQVIQQQNLQAKRNDLDAVASVRVGTLLGASMLVAGAYQKSGPQVRLTARFVDVATGEIKGTAKVDGAAAELLGLEDRVTGELLRSAGLKPRAPPRRPRLRSWKTVELYGDAAVETDPAKKKQILQAALDEDPDFVYAARDLAELDRRMGEWSRVASVKMGERERALLREIDDPKLPAAERARTASTLMSELYAARRFHALANVAGQLAQSPPGAPVREEATFRLFQARDRLRKVDLALQGGELYLSTFPTGPHYRDIETRMRELVEARRKRESRVAEWQADIADKRKDAHGEAYDYAPCIASRWDGQAGQRMLDACTTYLNKYANATDADAREHVIAARFFVILSLSELGQFDQARALADQLRTLTHSWDDDLQKLTAEWPTD